LQSDGVEIRRLGVGEGHTRAGDPAVPKRPKRGQKRKTAPWFNKARN